MKNWQKFVSEHHSIEVLSDTQIIVKAFIYDTINKITYDDLVTRTEYGYTDSQGNKYESIRDYLGY